MKLMLIQNWELSKDGKIVYYGMKNMLDKEVFKKIEEADEEIIATDDDIPF